jgi:DNA-binding PadR family transcriptional regulator
MHPRHHRHGRPRGPRVRWETAPGEWAVRARIERFVEPAVLLLLKEGPRHGYELLERLPELAGEERIDVGNLYRIMRALEQEGVVESEWNAELPGPAKRTYRLTDSGRELLDRWIEALQAAGKEISRFIERHEGR